jgi:hypothetical protein
MRAQTRDHECGGCGCVHSRHRAAKEDATSDQCHRGQNRQRPAQPTGGLPVQMMGVARQHRDQPYRRAKEGQGSNATGGERIDVNDNALARAAPRCDLDRWLVHSYLLMRVLSAGRLTCRFYPRIPGY